MTEKATEPDDAASLFMALNIEHTAKQLAGAIRALLALPERVGDKVGVVGFCMGGQLSMFAACDNPEIGACVNFYGVHPNVHPRFENFACPMLGLFAEEDAYASPEAVQTLDSVLTDLGKAHEFVTYPGTQHAFFNDERPSFHPEAAEDAWRRTTAFLRQN